VHGINATRNRIASTSVRRISATPTTARLYDQEGNVPMKQVFWNLLDAVLWRVGQVMKIWEMQFIVWNMSPLEQD